jgi:hypothetical protein
MKKYIEEVATGNIFVYKSSYWVLTTDFKNNGYRMCISLQDGFPFWFPPTSMVEEIEALTLDSNNNLIKLKQNNETTSTNTI